MAAMKTPAPHYIHRILVYDYSVKLDRGVTARVVPTQDGHIHIYIYIYVYSDTQNIKHRTYLRSRALAAQALDLPIAIDLVVLEDGEFGLLALVLDLLRGRVDLLLALLGAAAEA